LDERVERTLLPVMAEFDASHVEWYCAFALGDFHHLLGRHKQELGLWVDELPNEPRAGHPVHFHPLARDPTHHTPPPCRGAAAFRWSQHRPCLIAGASTPVLPSFITCQ